jgi:ABC-type bacteriocin/lantibiotic exporter with double-glycine peptidase domain
MSTLVILVASLAVSQTGQSHRADTKCGGYCLYFALRALDLTTEPYSSFEKRLPPLEEGGYSFDDLERIARQYEAHTRALEADMEALSRLDGRRVCIALLNRHFVIIKILIRSEMWFP